jgi:hypothetical protein
MAAEPRPAVSGRMLTGAAWAVLLTGLWLWGREISDLPAAPGGAAGALFTAGLPAAHPPVAGPAPPLRVDVPSLGIRAPVVPRGLDRDGAVDPPPYARPEAAGWYAAGAGPGEAGPALLVGHVDTRSKPAVFYGLSSAKRGDSVRVLRADGKTAEFTVERVAVHDREGFDPAEVYGPRVPGRAELRLITCGGAYDKKAREYSANVVVSAYLTGVRN